PGAQKLLVWDFNGVGLVLPQNILITQQFTITQGTSTRNGVVLCNASPTGSSPNYFYFGSSAFTEGFYTAGGNGQLGFLGATIPTTAGTNNPPVANSQSVIL